MGLATRLLYHARTHAKKKKNKQIAAYQVGRAPVRWQPFELDLRALMPAMRQKSSLSGDAFRSVAEANADNVYSLLTGLKKSKVSLPSLLKGND